MIDREIGQDAAHALAQLNSVRAHLERVDEDLLATLAIMGEPNAQRVLDEWIDQLVDSVRASGELIERHLGRAGGIPEVEASSMVPDSVEAVWP